MSVIGMPIVGARERIWVLDLGDVNGRVRAGSQYTVGGRRNAVGGGIIQRVGIAQHHVVGVGSAHRRLMVVVVEGIFAGQLGQIGRVAVGDIIEAHGDVAFLERLRQAAVAAGGDGLLDPGEEIGLTAARIVLGDFRDVAIELLPHLIETMNRAAAVGGIETGPLLRYQRIGTIGPVGVIQDTRVG